MSGMFVGDEIIKASMGSYVLNKWKLPPRRPSSLLQKNVTTKRVCETILHEEEGMAQWLDERLPGITRKYLAVSSRM
jgi:hypothetical protein